MLKTSIVIPNWNGREKLEKNLPKVLKVKDVDEIIVVDDASADDSVVFIKTNFPEINLITKEKNTGFGSNVNLGVSRARGDLIFLLNTDAVPEENCIRNAIYHFENPKVFGVGFNTGGNWSWARFEDGFFRHYQASGMVETHETLWVSGGSGLFRRKIWNELEGFDPIYDPFYVEDVDLGYRSWKRGYINVWEKGAKVEHYRQKGVIATHFQKEFVQNISERNMLYFTWKNILDQKMFNQHIGALLKRIITNPKFIPIFIRALLNFPKILKKRVAEKQKSLLSDAKILNKYSEAKY